MSRSTTERVRKRREALRKLGLRPVQIWAPDSRLPGFAAECRRQSRVVAAADRRDKAIFALLEQAAADLDTLLERQ